MQIENILLLITPKNKIACLEDHMSIRQALETMKYHRFTTIPVINKKTGEYIGSISEGDILYYLSDNDYSLKKMENTNIVSIIRNDFIQGVKIDADINEVIKLIVQQNYIPVVDDRNVLMGIITRASVINKLIQEEN